MEALQAAHRRWVEHAIEAGGKGREEEWTGSIAVGSRSFVEEVKGRLNIRAEGRRVIEHAEGCCLREMQDAYSAIFQGEKGALSLGNMHYWNIYAEESIG
jgi:putative transposase